MMKIKLPGIIVLILVIFYFNSNTVFGASATYPDAKCEEGGYFLNKAFGSTPLNDYLGTNVSPKPNPTDIIHYVPRYFRDNVSELFFTKTGVWLRNGVGSDIRSVSNKPFAFYTYETLWGNTTNKPDYANLKSVSYRVYNGKYGELITNGTTFWYREEATPGGNDFPASFTVLTPQQAWKNTTNGPDYTKPIDNITYRVINKKISELVFQGNAVYIREGTGVDANTIPNDSAWQKRDVQSIWSRANNLPSFPIKSVQYSVDINGWLGESFIKDSNIYIRYCYTVDYLKNTYLTKMMDNYLNIYSYNTDYSNALNPANYKPEHTNFYRAVLANAIAHTAKYYKYKTEVDKNKALYYLRSTINSYHIWGKNWLSSVTARDTLFIAWIFWDDLDFKEQNTIKIIAKNEANYYKLIFDRAVLKYSQNQLDHYDYRAINGRGDEKVNGVETGDTKSEENAGSAEFLAFASQMFNNSDWENYAKCYAFHTLTLKNPKSGDANTLCNIKTTTIYDDYSLQNHSYKPSVAYSLAAIASLQQGELAYVLKNKASPSEFRHNIQPLWEKFNTFYYPWEYNDISKIFKIKPEYNPGTDWGFPDILLALPEFSFVSNFGGASDKNYTDAEMNLMTFWGDRNWNKLPFTQNSVVTSMPVYDLNKEVVKNWFINGLTHSKGAGESLIYSLIKSKQIVTPLPSYSSRLDITGDKSVDSKDTTALIKHFFEEENNSSYFYDIDANSIFNLKDISEYVQY